MPQLSTGGQRRDYTADANALLAQAGFNADGSVKGSKTKSQEYFEKKRISHNAMGNGMR